MKKIVSGLIWIAGGLAVPAALFAQDPQIEWYAADGAGGVIGAQGGVYSLSGSVGQHGVTSHAGGPYAMTGGFWAYAVVQTPDAPMLEIEVLEGEVRVMWETTNGKHVLEECTNLSGPPAGAVWTEVPPPYQADKTHTYIMAPTPDTFRIYRLAQPSEKE